MIWILGVCLIAATVIVACEEVNVTEDIEKDKYKPTLPLTSGYVATSWTNDVDVQITWVAQGIAYYVQNRTFVNVVHDLCQMNHYFQSEFQPIEDEFEALTGIPFQNTHNDTVQIKINPNNYNKDFLPGFLMNTLDYTNHVYIPEADTVDTTKQLIIVPYRNWEINQSKPYTGFFLNPAKQLDSVRVSRQELPVDSYYIWIVGYDPDDNNFKDERCFPEGISYCGDSICDKYRNEDDPSHPNYCPGDCNGVNVAFNYKVIVESIQIYNDNATYFESWTRGKYDMFCKGATIRDTNVLDYFGDIDEDTDFKLGKIKKREACRIKSNGTPQGTCPAPVINVDKEIFNYFNPLTDTLFFVCYEQNSSSRYKMNYKLAGKHHPSYPKLNIPSVTFPCWFRRDNHVYGGFNPSAFYVNNNAAQVPQEQYGLMVAGTTFLANNNTHVFDNGEYRVTVKIISN
ncbi:MAG: hypothetical protein JXQ87_16765 [Bacteroidia bacterium]